MLGVSDTFPEYIDNLMKKNKQILFPPGQSQGVILVQFNLQFPLLLHFLGHTKGLIQDTQSTEPNTRYAWHLSLSHTQHLSIAH